MSDLMLQFVQALISVFEIWLCNQFLFATVIEKETLRKREKVVLWLNALVLGILLSINRNIIYYSAGMLYIVIGISCLIAMYVERSKKILVTVVVVLYHMLLTLFDFLFAFVSMIFLGAEFEQVVFWYTISWLRCGLYACSRVLMLLFLIVIKKRSNMRQNMYEFQNILIITDIVMLVLVRQYHYKLVEQAGDAQSMLGRTTSVSLLAIMFVIFFIVIILLANRIIQKENELLLVRDEMLRQNYQELEYRLEQTRGLTHDIKNHFLILKEYEKTKNYEAIHDYLQEMEKNYEDVAVYTWTGNRIVDCILEQKKEYSKKKEIQFLIEAIPIKEWKLNDSELCSVFGNLLDNAIEACERIKEDSRSIKIQIEKHGRMIFVRIQNTIAQKPLMKNGRSVSDKTDKKLHGYGLRNVERIIKKYEGEITYRTSNKMFEVSITFFE